MNIQVVIKNLDGKEIINIEDANNKNDFCYTDSYGASNHICITNDLIEIERMTQTHCTYVNLSKTKGYIEIESNEGVFNFDVKVVAFNIKHNIITIAYSLADEVRELEIKYLGVENGK